MRNACERHTEKTPNHCTNERQPRYEQERVCANEFNRNECKIHSKTVFIISSEPLLIKHKLYFAVMLGFSQAILLFCGISFLLIYILTNSCSGAILLRISQQASEQWDYYKGGGIPHEELVVPYVRNTMKDRAPTTIIKHNLLQRFFEVLLTVFSEMFKICLWQSVLILISFLFMIAGFYFRIIFCLFFSAVSLIVLLVISFIYINIYGAYRVAVTYSLTESTKTFDIAQCRICKLGYYSVELTENDKILFEQSRFGCCGILNYKSLNKSVRMPPAVCCKQFQRYDLDLKFNSEVHLNIIDYIEVNVPKCAEVDAKPGCLDIFQEMILDKFVVIRSIVSFASFITILNVLCVILLIVTLVFVINIFVCLVHFK